MLLNSVFARLAQVEVGKQPPQPRSRASRTSGCSILLNQPMSRVSRRRGMRLVSRKLMSSCCKISQHRGAHCHRTVRPALLRFAAMDSHYTTFALYALGAGALTTSLRQAERPPRAVEGEAPLAHRPCPDGAPDRRDGAVLRIRRAPLLPRRRRAGRGRGARARPASCGSRRCSPTRYRRNRAADRRDPRRRLGPAVHRRLPGAVPVQPLGAPASAGRGASCSRRPA